MHQANIEQIKDASLPRKLQVGGQGLEGNNRLREAASDGIGAGFYAIPSL